MSRKFIAALAVGAMLALATPGVALAAGGDANLNVTIPSALTFAFVGSPSVNFGTVLPGATKEITNALAYTITTNDSAGFSVATSAGVNPPSGIQFAIMDSLVGGASYQNLNAGPIGGMFTGDSGAGTYTDNINAKVTLAPDAPGGTFGQSVTFLATAA